LSCTLRIQIAGAGSRQRRAPRRHGARCLGPHWEGPKLPRDLGAFKEFGQTIR
jgi:hypothetical protein